MALDKSEDWRKGNPKWKKGHKMGRPKDARSKANSSTKKTLNRLDRHPVEELIKIADLAMLDKNYVFAREIWERIHEESTAHNTEEQAEQRKAEKTLVKELEDAPQPKETDIRTQKPIGEQVSPTDSSLRTALENDSSGADKTVPV